MNNEIKTEETKPIEKITIDNKLIHEAMAAVAYGIEYLKLVAADYRAELYDNPNILCRTLSEKVRNGSIAMHNVLSKLRVIASPIKEP